MLHLEDFPSDAELVENTLKKNGLPVNIRWVDNEADFRKALVSFAPDAIISDHQLPSFTSVEAFQIFKASGLRIPFILVTATISEEFAVTMMREGVDDYVLKDRIQRLPNALVNALQKVKAERDRELYYNKMISSGKRFQALVENISEAIMVVSSRGQITYTCPAVKRIMGFDHDEMHGRQFSNFIYATDYAGMARFFDAPAARPYVFHEHTFRVICSDGGYLWVEGTISSFESEAGEHSFVVNCHDITRRRESALQLQESEAKLKTVLNNTEVSYVLTDVHLNIISFNHIAAKSYERELHAVISEGKNLTTLTPTSMPRETLSKFRHALKGELVSYETSFDNDGQKNWYQVKLLPVHDDHKEVRGLLVSSENITTRKLHEIERDKMTADILRHNKNLEQFSYIVSHNLRAPVANIMGLAMLAGNSAMLSKADFDKCINGLQQAARRLDEVILDLDQILQVRGAIKEKKQLIHFDALVDDIKASISSLIEKDNIHIDTHFEVNELFTVKSYLYSIFLNLITNSIKYRNPEIAAIISVSSQKHNNNIFLSFKDNGLGIDLQAHGDKLFGLYKKFHMDKEGKGMGLYMVKTQVEMLGGQISVTSEVNKGTEFILQFED